MWYRGRLDELVKHVRQAGARLLETLRSVWPEPTPTYFSGDAFDLTPLSEHGAALAAGEFAVGDALVPKLAHALEQAAASFGNLTRLYNRWAALAARKGLAAVDKRLAAEIRASVGVDISAALTGQGAISEALRAAARENAALISSIPEKYLEGVSGVVTTAWETGLRFEAVVARIAHIGDLTEHRAWVIARDQTAKMNASFNQVRQTDLGIKQYTWSDVGDRRVRPSHSFMNGRVCRWDSPPEVEGQRVHPGQAILCRCSAIPHINLAMLDLGADEAEAA